MLSDVAPLLVGVPVAALWGLTVSATVEHPLRHWAQAGRSKSRWVWAHLLSILTVVGAPLVSAAFLVAVWPRLRRAARTSPPEGTPGRQAREVVVDESTDAGAETRTQTDTGVLAVRRGLGGMGFLSRMHVAVDGAVAARIRPGEVVEVTVPAGRHRLQARMSWQASTPLLVEVQPGSTVRIAVAMGEAAMTFDGTFLRPEEAIDLAVVQTFSRW